MKTKLLKLAKHLSFDSNLQHQLISLAEWSWEQKSILILIHPDCAVELPEEQATAYFKKILLISKGAFDHIFTNLMFSDYCTNPSFPWADRPVYPLFLKAREHLQNISTFEHDRSMGSKAFGGAIGDYLMENENVVVFMGGGYQDLCLKQSYDNFCSVLNWVVKEQKHQVVIDKQLVFYRRLNFDTTTFTPHENDWWKDLEHFDLSYGESESQPEDDEPHLQQDLEKHQ